MHDVIIVGVPLFAILAGILCNRSDFRDLRFEIKDLRSEMQARPNRMESHLDRIDADLRPVYHLTGKLEARMDPFGK